jgi:hypothetical protein
LLEPNYILTECGLDVVTKLCERFHGYGSAGKSATYAFAVWEFGEPVAAFAWQPPPRGAAANVCSEEPSAVLALSRMVAVPKELRQLQHISKPLRRQMRTLIDRTRWPVLVTYSDEGQGHTGHVYKCSGWEKTLRTKRPTYEDGDGRRVSSYSNGKHDTSRLTRGEQTHIQRWEHWACARGEAGRWLRSHGWRRVLVSGRTWRSGNQAYTWERAERDVTMSLFRAK